MNIVFEISGGIGKNIIATVILELLRKKYSKDNIIVISDSKSIFFNNPHANIVVGFDERNSILDRYVHHQLYNCLVLIKDVYNEPDYISNKGNIYEIWAKMYDLEYNGEKPKLYLSEEEKLNPLKLNNTKPILVIHPQGGAIIKDGENQLISHYIKPLNYNWSRDLPIKLTKQIIENYKDEYDIYYIKHPSQPIIYEGAKPAEFNIRGIISLLQQSDKRILIDSFSQHMAAALDLPSTVCWVTTKPEMLGYTIHNNVKSNPFEFETDMNCYSGYNLVEPLNHLPYKSTANIFNIKQITK